MNAYQAAATERKRVILGSTAREMGLLKRVPELFKRRGWTATEDVTAVVIAAVVCVQVNAYRQRFRRPPGAEECGGKWPDGSTAIALQIVRGLELEELWA